MTVGELSKSELWEEYYTNLHKAYNAMWQAFKKRGLSQDQIAERLGVDKALISKRLKGTDNLTLKTLSFMASAMECRLTIDYVPYENVQAAAFGNVYTFSDTAGGTARPSPESGVSKAA